MGGYSADMGKPADHAAFVDGADGACGLGLYRPVSDQIADAVEQRHYPSLPPARHIGLSEGIWDSIRFLGVLLAANLVALVLYITPLAPFVFWGLNGFLLGREYSQMVAIRRETPEGAARFRSENRMTIFVAGVLMAVPLTIPVVNLLVPILGAASFTHIYNRITRSRS